MRAFENFKEVLSEVQRDLKELAVVYQSGNVQDKNVRQDPGYLTHELTNYNYTLTHPGTVFVPPDQAFYITAELEERLGGEPLNPGVAWEQDREYWQQFLHRNDDGEMEFSYTYSERMADELNWAIHTLYQDPQSRRAWIPIFHPDDVYAAPKHIRIPCSLGYGFMIRQDHLHMNYIMRSCDFVKHFHKDVVLAVAIQKHVVNKLWERGLKVHQGTFTHMIFSLHAFAKDLEGVF